MKQKVITLLKSKSFYVAFVRYYLSLSMMPYAISKIMQTQFVLLPFSFWQKPLETLSGKSITWAFFGYSPWFQILLGILEFIPAILLLFRRTTLLGAILLLPITLNVCLVNYALDLWSATKQISLTFLLLNMLILLLEWRRIKIIVATVLDKGNNTKYLLAEILLGISLLTVCLYFSISDLNRYKKQENFLTGKWTAQKPNEWTLISEKINDSLQKPRLQKSYFGAYGDYSEINNEGFTKRDSISYTLDEIHHSIKFTNKADIISKTYSYAILDSNTLLLKLYLDSNKNRTLVQQFKRRVIHQNSAQ